MLFLAAVPCNALHFVFGDTQLYRHVKAIFVLMNCYGITNLFLRKLTFIENQTFLRKFGAIQYVRTYIRIHNSSTLILFICPM